MSNRNGRDNGGQPSSTRSASTVDPCATLSARPYNAEKHEDKRVAEGWPEVEGSFSIRRRFRFSEGRRGVGEGGRGEGEKLEQREERSKKREREEETTERVDDDVPRPRILSPSPRPRLLPNSLSLSLSHSADPFGQIVSLSCNAVFPVSLGKSKSRQTKGRAVADRPGLDKRPIARL